MKERFCSLIVLGPGAPNTFKLHLSRTAIVILVIAFLISFLAVIWAGHTLPSGVSDVNRTRLEAENHALKMETANAAIGIQRLNAKVAELEELSQRIEQITVSPTGSPAD
jgi:hypothetical protein